MLRVCCLIWSRAWGLCLKGLGRDGGERERKRESEDEGRAGCFVVRGGAAWTEKTSHEEVL